jgi:hypothetical protein
LSKNGVAVRRRHASPTATENILTAQFQLSTDLRHRTPLVRKSNSFPLPGAVFSVENGADRKRPPACANDKFHFNKKLKDLCLIDRIRFVSTAISEVALINSQEDWKSGILNRILTSHYRNEAGIHVDSGADTRELVHHLKGSEP